MSNPTTPSAENPAQDAAFLLLRVGLSVIAMAVPVSMALSRRAVFTLLPIGAGLVLVAGLLLSDVPIRRRIATALFSTAGLCGLALIGWSALSLLWSPVGAVGTERLAKTAGTLLLVALTAAFLPERTRTSNLNLFPLGILAAVAVTLFIAFAAPGAAAAVQGEDSTLQRAIVTLVVLVWPALGAMAIRGRWSSAVVVVVAVMIAAMASWSSITLAALGLGAVAFVLGTTNPARLGRILGRLAAATILLGPLVPFVVALVLKPLAVFGGHLPDLQPALESMRVWADMVVGDPVRLVTGHGIAMANVATSVGFLPPETPRSLLFELWYDFGVIGAVLTAVLVDSAFGIVGRLSPTVAPFLLAEIVAMLTIVFTGLETTQLWWVTMAGVVTLAFATVVRGEYRTKRPLARLEPQIAPLPR